MKIHSFVLRKDNRGAIWDALLYVPTVSALLLIAFVVWYQDNSSLTYLLVFLASFFGIVGANRILKTRLMILPSAPVALDVAHSADNAVVHLKNGETRALLKEVKYYGDLSGKTFGLTGMDDHGRRQQFIFHRGQFALEKDYQQIKDIFKK
jgi:vacuolar-type H+-ATPase subunit I/STV1